MTPQDESEVRRYATANPSGRPVVRLNATSGAADRLLEDFCRELERLVPNLTLMRHLRPPLITPALVIGPHANIAYQAVPAGPLLKPFLSTLGGDDIPHALDSRLAAMLQQLTRPVECTLFISSSCPFCPEAIGRLSPLAVATPQIRLTVVDARLFADQAQAHEVRSVPLLILDGQYRWSGLPEIKELVAVCLERDPSLISPESLRRIIEAGDARVAADMMMTAGRIFPALISLLVDEKWPVRLGAMVTVEYLNETAPELAELIVADLWQNFRRCQPAVQGDIAHVLGTIGSAEARKCLQRMAAGPFEQEVVQAAVEALDELKSG